MTLASSKQQSSKQGASSKRAASHEPRAESREQKAKRSSKQSYLSAAAENLLNASISRLAVCIRQLELHWGQARAANALLAGATDSAVDLRAVNTEDALVHLATLVRVLDIPDLLACAVKYHDLWPHAAEPTKTERFVHLTGRSKMPITKHKGLASWLSGK